MSPHICYNVGGPLRPMMPGRNMPMGLPGPVPGAFGGTPSFRPQGMPMGPSAGPARPPGAELDALLSKQTVQGRARTERYVMLLCMTGHSCHLCILVCELCTSCILGHWLTVMSLYTPHSFIVGQSWPFLTLYRSMHTCCVTSNH